MKNKDLSQKIELNGSLFSQLNKGNNNFSRKKLLFFTPILYIISSLLISYQRGYYWLGLNSDPEYAYLLNSLNIANQKTPGHTDHPGTTLQILGSILIQIYYSLHSILTPFSGTLNEVVLKNSEEYLRVINLTLLSFSAICILGVGLISFLFFRSISLSLILQITPFLTSSNLLASTRVSPELLLFDLSQLLIVILLVFLYYNPSEKSLWFSVSLGIVLGLGIATKVTFLPLIIFLFILPKTTDKILSLTIALLTFIITTIPIFKAYPRMFKWLLGIATHTGRYGSGDQGFIEVTKIGKNIMGLFNQEPIFFFIVFISTFGLIGLFFLSKYIANNNQEQNQYLLFRKITILLGLTLGCLWGQIFMTVKHPASHYLIPAMGFCGFVIFLQVFSISLLIQRKRIVTIISLLCLTTFISLGARQFSMNLNSISRTYKIHSEELQNIQSIITRKYRDCHRLYYYRSSSLEYALHFGNNFANNDFSRLLSQLYPTSKFYNIWKRTYSSYDQSLEVSNLLQKKCVILQGTPLKQYPERLQPKISLQTIFVGDYEGLYRIKSFNNSPDD